VHRNLPEDSRRWCLRRGDPMFSHKGMQDTMTRFLDEIAQNFSEFNIPLSHWYMFSLKHFLEFQLIFLKCYQKNIHDQEFDNSLEDNIKGMMRNLMASHIEFMRLERQSREKFLKMQSEIIDNYLEVLGNTLKTMHEQQV
jgi:hypothetical protein